VCSDKVRKQKAKIKVVVKNKPNVKTSKEKIKELSKFLSATWSIDKNSK